MVVHLTQIQQKPRKKDTLDISFKDLSPEELRAMGIEGDTSKDTVRTLIGKVKEHNKRFDEVILQNERLVKENEQLKNQANKYGLSNSTGGTSRNRGVN